MTARAETSKLYFYWWFDKKSSYFTFSWVPSPITTNKHIRDLNSHYDKYKKIFMELNIHSDFFSKVIFNRSDKSKHKWREFESEIVATDFPTSLFFAIWACWSLSIDCARYGGAVTARREFKKLPKKYVYPKNI